VELSVSSIAESYDKRLWSTTPSIQRYHKSTTRINALLCVGLNTVAKDIGQLFLHECGALCCCGGFWRSSGWRGISDFDY